jgi:hypothetical protein
VLLALGLLSAAVTGHQIALMQVLGWMHWHHFAYMIVAIALLGFGLAGPVLALARARLQRAWRPLLPWLALGTAIAMPLGVRLAQTEALAVDLPLVFLHPPEAWRLVALCGLLLPPFFCGGLATGLVLAAQAARAARAGRFYAASLAGAGAGGLAGVALVASVIPARLPASVALIALGAAICRWRETGTRTRIAILVTAIALVAAWLAPGELRASQFKPIRRALDLPEARVVAARPGVHGWVQVVDAPALRPAPGVSLDFTGEIPRQRAVFVNGLGHGSLLTSAAIRAPTWLDQTTDASAFVAAQPHNVLLLENGPGGWAALAVRHGAARIVVVEPNPALVNLLQAGDAPLAPEWRLPAVTCVVTRGRAYLRRTRETFDVIRFPSVGALGGTSGLAAASEQFLLTREAFIDAWQRLAPGGVIAITAWMDFPERNSLRLLATLAETLEAVGARPSTDLVAIRGWATVTFLARRPHAAGAPAWNVIDVAAVRAFCRDRGFDPLLLPGLQAAEREAHHAWQNPGFFQVVDALVDGPREPVYRESAFLLRPTTDDRPYFSQFLRWSAWHRLREVFGARAMPSFEMGSLVVALTFVILALLALVGVVLPLARLGWHGRGKAGVLLYFGGLGAGFMAVEIGLMLRAQAWLGSPVLAVAVVLTVLLLASGLGSAWSDRLPANGPTARRITAIIAGAVLLASLLFDVIGPAARAWPALGQTGFVLAIVAPIGLALGVAFPVGLRRIAATEPNHVAWAWAVNGCVSVATPAGAMLLAMGAGFGALFAAGAAAYGLAFVGACLVSPRKA